MSVKVMAMVFERYPNGGGEMLLALALADHAKDDGTKIYPSVETLATKTRQSERSVQYQLRRMEESGWLLLVGNEGGGRNKAREYRINPDWINGAEISPFVQEKGANDDMKGCNPEHERVQPTTEKGATAIAPEPSVTISEPSGTVITDLPVQKPFDRFYGIYPKRVKRKPAEAIWDRKKLDGMVDRLLADVELRKRADRRWIEGYVPDPTTYLNQERWNDEIQTQNNGRKNGTAKKYSPFDQLEHPQNREPAGGPLDVLPHGGDLHSEVHQRGDESDSAGPGRE